MIYIYNLESSLLGYDVYSTCRRSVVASTTAMSSGPPSNVVSIVARAYLTEEQTNTHTHTHTHTHSVTCILPANSHICVVELQTLFFKNNINLIIRDATKTQTTHGLFCGIRM